METQGVYRSSERCPICRSPLFVMKSLHGVIVWCGKSKTTHPDESITFGSGRTEKEAYQELMNKVGEPELLSKQLQEIAQDDEIHANIIIDRETVGGYRTAARPSRATPR